MNTAYLREANLPKVSLFRTENGFTLVETLIVIAILAIITSLAAPNLLPLLTKNHARIEADSLAHALRLARSEARTRLADTRAGLLVTLCPSNADGSACDNNINSWQTNGWLLFANRDGNPGYAASGMDQLLSQRLLPANSSVNVTFNPAPPAGAITFSEFGSNATEITFSNPHTTASYQITLTPTGQVITTTTSS